MRLLSATRCMISILCPVSNTHRLWPPVTLEKKCFCDCSGPTRRGRGCRGAGQRNTEDREEEEALSHEGGWFVKSKGSKFNKGVYHIGSLWRQHMLLLQRCRCSNYLSLIVTPVQWWDKFDYKACFVTVPLSHRSPVIQDYSLQRVHVRLNFSHLYCSFLWVGSL